MTPQQLKKKVIVNEPMYLHEVAIKIASIKKVSVDYIINATVKTTEIVFGINLNNNVCNNSLDKKTFKLNESDFPLLC